MSAFDKENNREANAHEVDYASRVYEVSDEDSTIFSAPEEHRQKQQTKGTAKKVRKIILSSVALVLVAAIITLVVIFIPKNEEDNSSSQLDDIPIMEESLFAEVDRVNLITDEHRVDFRKVSAVRNDKETEEWALADVDPTLTSYSNIDNTVTSFMKQSYNKIISEDKNDGKEYGFDDPKYQVDFYKKGEDSIYFSLIIGGYTPTDSGRYATTTLDDRVYFVRDTGFYHYTKDKLAFVEAESIPAIAKDATYSDKNYTEGTLILCDKMTISSKKLGGTYKLVYKDTDNITVFTNYHFTAPVARPANDEAIGDIVSLFSFGITSSGCYSYSNTQEDIEKFGLDDPDFEVEMKVGDLTTGFKATLQEDGNYAVYYKDNRTIMKVAPDSIAPAAYTRKDVFNTLLFIENITTASSVIVESGKDKVDFRISTTFDEENNRDTLSSVKANGKVITTVNFQNYYSHIIAITPQSFDEEDIKGIAPATTLTIKHNNGTADTVVKYYPVKAARYQVVVNGIKMGLVSAGDHARIMKYAQNVAADKTFNSR